MKIAHFIRDKAEMRLQMSHVGHSYSDTLAMSERVFGMFLNCVAKRMTIIENLAIKTLLEITTYYISFDLDGSPYQFQYKGVIFSQSF